MTKQRLLKSGMILFKLGHIFVNHEKFSFFIQQQKSSTTTKNGDISSTATLVFYVEGRNRFDIFRIYFSGTIAKVDIHVFIQTGTPVIGIIPDRDTVDHKQGLICSFE